MVRTVTLVCAAALVAVVTGCGGSGNKSFTEKVVDQGNTTYIVVSVPAAQATAIKDAYVARERKTRGPGKFTTQSPQGPLDCSQSGKIGQHHSESPRLRSYVGVPETVKVYGTGFEANADCSALRKQGI
jgi:hypothetical protein